MVRVNCVKCKEVTEAKLIEEGQDYGGKFKIYECSICKMEIRVDE